VGKRLQPSIRSRTLSVCINNHACSQQNLSFSRERVSSFLSCSLSLSLFLSLRLALSLSLSCSLLNGFSLTLARALSQFWSRCISVMGPLCCSLSLFLLHSLLLPLFLYASGLFCHTLPPSLSVSASPHLSSSVCISLSCCLFRSVTLCVYVLVCSLPVSVSCNPVRSLCLHVTVSLSLSRSPSRGAVPSPCRPLVTLPLYFFSLPVSPTLSLPLWLCVIVTLARVLSRFGPRCISIMVLLCYSLSLFLSRSLWLPFMYAGG